MDLKPSKDKKHFLKTTFEHQQLVLRLVKQQWLPLFIRFWEEGQVPSVIYKNTRPLSCYVLPDNYQYCTGSLMLELFGCA